MAASATLGVCLALASAPQASLTFVPVQAFTLAWTHSIENVRWEEDYTIKEDPRVGDQASPVLRAGTARIRGSAAGMEPPPEAVLRHGWYEYQPPAWPRTPLRLTRSGFTPDYDWCVQGSCHPLESLLPTDGGVTLLSPCRRP